MNKSQFITALADNQSITKKQAAVNLEAVLSTITTELAAGNDIQFIGFGSFSTAIRPSRSGLNPSTGKPMQIESSTAVKFKSGKALKSAVN